MTRHTDKDHCHNHTGSGTPAGITIISLHDAPLPAVMQLMMATSFWSEQDNHVYVFDHGNTLTDGLVIIIFWRDSTKLLSVAVRS